MTAPKAIVQAGWKKDMNPADIVKEVDPVLSAKAAAEEWFAGHLPATIQPITGDADFDSLLHECAKVLRVKGADYTLGKGVPGSNRADRLANFYAASAFTGLTPFNTWAIYFYKHVSAVFTFCQKGQVESEPIEGRLVDIINYCLLLSKMIKHEQEKAK